MKSLGKELPVCLPNCQEAFNGKFPVCCFLSLLSPLFLISPCQGARGAGKPLP